VSKPDQKCAEILGYKMVWFDRVTDFGGDWSQTGPYQDKADCRHKAIAYWQEPDGTCLVLVGDFSPTTDSTWLPRLFSHVAALHVESTYLDYLVDIVLPYAHYELRSREIWHIVTAAPSQHVEAFIRTCGYEAGTA